MKLIYDLNYLCESEMSRKGLNPFSYNFQEKIEFLREIIFDFEYPLSEKYKTEFETSFITQFWFNEISNEIYTRWHYELQQVLIVNSKRFNVIYESYLGDITQAINMVSLESVSEMSGSQSGDNTSGGKTTTRAENFNENRGNDMPQGRNEIDIDYVSSLSDNRGVAESSGDSSETTKMSAKSDSKSKNTSKGYSGVPLVQLHRMYAESVVIPNEMILFAMRKLFLQTVI